ncbi:MAG: hypothetical protein KF760_21665 [Candidatus Eremiobacteraeota bacterium]|nr:hypothetical protein [Candidatus Eremiobacteraeota bacterium]MCW5872669.1 hypothetical protein [Candidatus Eremiobacteraeota bacterium]
MGQPRKLKGYALMMAIGLIATLFLLGLALVHFMTAQRSLLRKAEDTSLAREASRAGVDFALAQLRADPAWRQGFAGLSAMPGTAANLTVQEQGDQLKLLCQARANDTSAAYAALVRPARVLLHNDFTHEASQWSQPGSLPVVLLGYYLLNLSLQGEASAGDPLWTDYEAEFEILLPQATGIGLVVRESPAGDYLVDYSLLRGSVQLIKERNGSRQVVAEVARRDLQLPHNFKIRAEQADLTVSLDGQKLLTYRDPEPLKNGRIAIRPLLNLVTLVDEVTVRQIFRVTAQWRP